MSQNLRIAVFAAYVIACVVLTHLPPPAVPRVSIPGLDKVIHFLIYFGMGFFIVRTWRFSRLMSVLLGVLVFAAIDEITQPPFGRTADIFDWICDAVGAGLGIWWSVRLGASGPRGGPARPATR